MAAYMTTNGSNATNIAIDEGQGISSTTYDSLLGRVRGVIGMEPKKKEKVKIHSDEAVVADTMVGFLKSKETDLKSKLDTKSREKAEVEAKIKELIKKARTLQSTTGTLAKKYADTVNKNRSEVVDDYRKVITKIKLLDFIEKFEVDSKKRILFTTTPVSIQKPDWTEAKMAGRYQVRIDFKKGNIGEGVQGINIDQHYNEYDHPNLKSGKFCYGSKLAIDVEQDYREQDLYELVIDLVDLLRSPNDKDGWTRWGYFFQGAKKRAKGYSFQKWDNEDIETGLGSAYELINDTLSTFTTQYAGNASLGMTGTTGGNYYPMQAPQPWELPSTRRMGYGEDSLESVAIHLLRLGFIDHRTAQYYANRILDRTRGVFPTSIELRRTSSDPAGDYELYYRFRNEQSRISMSMEQAPSPISERAREMVDRMLVPANLLRPEGSAPALDERELRRMEMEMREESRRMENDMRNSQQNLQNASQQMAQRMQDLAQARESAMGIPQQSTTGPRPQYATNEELNSIINPEDVRI